MGPFEQGRRGAYYNAAIAQLEHAGLVYPCFCSRKELRSLAGAPHGERTGVFRLGEDQLLSNAQGSSITFEDYAIAFVDELEHPKHIRRRFTVGY